MPLFISKRRLRKQRDELYQKLLLEIETTRSRNDIPAELILQFEHEKESPTFLSTYTLDEPLVSVCTGTYNRSKLLAERAIDSLINQTYKNIEIVVVGDGCTDNTQDVLASFGDSRIKFINLEERGAYPPDGLRRWMVAGTTAVNKALELAQGDFICHCDDDDRFDPQRIEKLVNVMREQSPHFIYHPFHYQQYSGDWAINKATRLELGYVTTSSMFYHRWFKQIPWDIEAWRYNEPGDWNRIRKIRYIGAKMLRYNEPLIWHYREQNQQAE
jgi:glycosyltransferase involved in cell wall biosynthesis